VQRTRGSGSRSNIVDIVIVRYGTQQTELLDYLRQVLQNLFMGSGEAIRLLRIK
jgi:hypothetical protein